MFIGSRSISKYVSYYLNKFKSILPVYLLNIKILQCVYFNLFCCFSADRYGRVPLHSAAHWKLKELIRILLEANSYVNVVDYKGRTPLYVCVASLSTGLYKEDLKYQVPCIKVTLSFNYFSEKKMVEI